jgi:hypothetical protein
MFYQEQFAERSALHAQIGDLQDDIFLLEADMQRAASKILQAYSQQKQEVSTSPHKWQHPSIRDTSFKKSWVRFELSFTSHEFFVELPSFLMDLEGDDLNDEISRILHEEGEKFEAIRAQQAADRESAEVERLKRLADELGYTVFPK